MKKLLLALALGAIAASSYATDYYVIGSNVNGKSWSAGASDAKFTQTGTNTYEWTGTILGTGFKINDGTWSNDDVNFGSNGAELTLGNPYTMSVGGSTGNIAISGVTEVKNPKIVLNMANAKAPVITLTGEGAGDIKWYLCGINNTWKAEDDASAIELKATSTANVLQSDAFTVSVTTGQFKIASTNWAAEYGQNENPATITNTNLSATLEEVSGEGGNLQYALKTGSYSATFNLSTKVLTFKEENVSSEDAEPATLYLLGTMEDSNWNAASKYKMTYDGNGIYSINTSLASGTKFKISVSGWNDAYNYGVPESEEDKSVTPSGTIKLANGPSSKDIILASAYEGVLTLDILNLTLTFGTDVEVPTPTYTIYVRGEFNGWGTDTPMTYNAEKDVYTATVSIPEGGDGFKIATEDWATVNYGLASEGTVKPEGTIALSNNDAVNIVLTEAYEGILTFSLTNGTLTFGTDVEVPTPANTIYLRGSMGGTDWPCLAEYAFKEVNGVYVLTLPEAIAVGDEFKIATEDWSTVNYGLSEAGAVKPEGTITLSNNDGKNISLTAAYEGVLTFDLAAGTLTFGTAAAPTVYLRGAFNNWGTDDAFTYNAETGVYSIECKIPENSSFKIADGTWGSVNYGITYTGEGEPNDNSFTLIDPSNSYNLTFNTNNIQLSKEFDGVISFQIVKAGESAKLTFGVDASVENVAAEAAPARFFNLQGVEVAQPAAGNVYIKVVGKTATKVLVK